MSLRIPAVAAFFALLGCADCLEVVSAVHAKAAAQVVSKAPSGKVDKVIQMLKNLVVEVDAQQVQDDVQFKVFSEWCTTQQAAAQESSERLQVTIEEVTAAFAELHARKGEFDEDLKRLKGEIATEKTQIKQAMDKRAEEHANFVNEQSDFDGSISACHKANEILKAHYGDGEVKQAEKPAWMSLVQLEQKIRETVSSRGINMALVAGSFLQGDRYQASGDGLSIVDQMTVLKETFMDDKQSAIDEENRLQKVFNGLMKEKGELLASLTAERDSQQAILDSVNQTIAQKEMAKSNAEAELKDEQAYLAQTKRTCNDNALLYKMRTEDRAGEKLAVGEAIKMLSGSAGEDLMQLGRRPETLLQVSAKTRLFSRGCPRCRMAATLLQQAAIRIKSGILLSAAVATMGSEAVQDVMAALDNVLDRMKEDAKMEEKHKDWCEDEMSEATEKKEYAEGMIEELTDEISNEVAVIAEKTGNIQHTASDEAKTDAIHQAHPEHHANGEGDDAKAEIDLKDRNFDEAAKFRNQNKLAADKAVEDYKETLGALNQAIDILSKFYLAKRKPAWTSMVEEGEEQRAARNAVAPGEFDGVYESKGGKGVIEMIISVRTEFEQGMKDVIKAEEQAQADFEKVKAEYQKTLNDLISKLNLLIVQRTQANDAKEGFEEDKKQEQEEVKAETAYLLQLAGSCNSLLEHYTERVQMRNDEKAAIKKAKSVLENEA